MVEFADSEELEGWLKDKPPEWSQIIAARAALRVLPYGTAPTAMVQVKEFPLAMFRATALAWASRNYPAHDMADAANAAADFPIAVHGVPDAAVGADANATYGAAFFAAKAAADAAHAANAAATAVSSVARNPFADLKARATRVSANAIAKRAISTDCDWLADQSDAVRAPRALSNRSLWHGKPPTEWSTTWVTAAEWLEQTDPNYSFWTDWLDRRIRGKRSAFEIPGDKQRKEDKWLLRKISDATGQELWDHRPVYVNLQLASWLDEARQRAAEQQRKDRELEALMGDILDASLAKSKPDFQIPPSTGSRIYGPNEQGLLDRLPPDQQDQLRDNPNQRRSYQHIRDDLEELLGEGQRLGPKLQKLLKRALADFPEDFANAEADIIWRHIGKLRRAYRKHLAAVQNAEFFEDKLDAQIAIDLDGVLGLMNNFVFGDQGLIRRQENSVDPQLRPDRAEEAKAAEPLVEALTASEGVATEEVKDDLRKGQDDLADALPSAEKGDPSADAEVDGINGERRNIVGGLLTGTRDTLKDARSGAAKEGGKKGLNFIIENRETLLAYASKAFAPETYAAIGRWIISLIS